jgi:rhodanese-related sulfurtransferase
MSSDADLRGLVMSYAGDLNVNEAWQLLAAEKGAQLIDVRTLPEWSFVGRPDLGNLGKAPILLSWQAYPQMAVDADFVTKLTEKLAAGDKDTPLLFLCRSGARSKAAALAATAAGYTKCYNIAGGFEGDRDAAGHRSSVGGWRFAGLPWTQD